MKKQAETLAQAIEEAIHSRDLSARVASLKAGLSESAIKHILRGTSGSPKVDTSLGLLIRTTFLFSFLLMLMDLSPETWREMALILFLLRTRLRKLSIMLRRLLGSGSGAT